MTNQLLLPPEIDQRYEVREWRNGLAILAAAHPQEWADILAVLGEFRLLRSDILKPGGRKTDIATKLDSHFVRLGWQEKGFDTRIVVDNTWHPPTRSTATRTAWPSMSSGTTRIRFTIAT